jgi:adenylate cyclase
MMQMREIKFWFKQLSFASSVKMKISKAYPYKLFRRIVNFSILTLFLSFTGGWINLPVLDRLENIFYDLRLRATLKNEIDPRIVIIDIDESSLAEEGRWPWPRNKLAELTNKLFTDYRVALLAFDVVFPEVDNSSGINWLRELAQGTLSQDTLFLQAFNSLQPKLAFDEIFAASLKNRTVVLGFFCRNSEDTESVEQQIKPVAAAQPFSNLLPLAKGIGGNLPLLQKAVTASGFFNNPMVDQDGVYRRVPLLVEHQSYLYESLALAIYRKFRSAQQLEFVTDVSEQSAVSTLEGIKVLDQVIPTDPHSSILVPYRGKQGSFNYFSASDILHGRVEPAQLTGKIAIIGTTATGLSDLRSTPVQSVYPGVEIHANIVSGLLDQKIKSKPGYMLGFEMLEILVLGLTAVFFLSRLALLQGLLLFLFLVVLVVATNFMLWDWFNIETMLFVPLLEVSILFIAQINFSYLQETRRKKQLSKNFSQYVPPELVAQMVKSDEEFSLVGENREMTVMFTDIRGFTSISENLEPQELTELMNRFLDWVTKIIHQHQGTIDKYMGDAVMAFWGAPLHDQAHADHAISAALAIIPALQEFNLKQTERGWPEIIIGIGINSGNMCVGNMGSNFRMAYTVLGDAVNLGSRLEGLTKRYQCRIIVSEMTRNLATRYAYRELDIVRVKGKKEPIGIFEPVDAIEKMNTSLLVELQLQKTAIDLYRERQWRSAREQFEKLTIAYPDVFLYRLYLKRLDVFQSSPPPSDWDGVYTYLKK